MSPESGDPPPVPRRPRHPTPPPRSPAQPPPAPAEGDQGAQRPEGAKRPEYTLYRAGTRSLRRRKSEAAAPVAGALRERPPRGGWRRRITPRRVILGLIAFVVGWLALSVLLFLISATVNQAKPKGDVGAVLDGAGFPLTSATNVLVLGSDQRTTKHHEPGASTSGPSRSDVIMLIRTGGGHSARLSIPRDTVVDIPGHGMQKINAAYAFGGAPLAIRTVKSFLGVPINHVVEVNFDNFPQLIDAMGGVDVKTGCVVSFINGGFRNGGYTLRLRAGNNHLSGAQALALARTRHNACHPNESDLTRATRQQALFQAMKSRLASPSNFFRLPWVSWDAPQAIRSDMGGFSLLGLFASLAVNGSPQTRLLTPTGTTTLPDGSSGLTVSESAKRTAVASFLRG
jgi:LCP family protein required for cell wall assembly